MRRGRLAMEVRSHTAGNVQPVFSEASGHWRFGNASSTAESNAEGGAVPAVDADDGVEVRHLAEAGEAGFFTVAAVRDLWWHDCNWQAWALRQCATWTPKLDCEGKAALTTLVALMQKNTDRNALSVRRPLLLNAAMALKKNIGKELSNCITHWGHAILHLEFSGALPWKADGCA